MEKAFARAAHIQLVIFDVDGVLTDGRLYFGEDGTEYKAFHSRDGLGMRMLRESGVAIAVITGRSSELVARRMASLGIEHLYQGQTDKLSAFQSLLRRLKLPASNTAYVGDDLVDLPPMRRAGVAIAVADAHPLVAQHAHWQTPSGGGRGAAREVCEFILQAQGKLERAYRPYLR